MRRCVAVSLPLVVSLMAAACNPFYSVEQSDVERGYRWISRGDLSRAIQTFEQTLKDKPESGLATLGLADALAQSVKRALRDCDLFVAIGTSGLVTPAANYVRGAEYAGARTILVNLEPAALPNPAFKEQYLGPAEEVLPALLATYA